MKRPILIHPDPRLKKVCAPLDDISDAVRARTLSSRASVAHYGGRGPPQELHGTSMLAACAFEGLKNMPEARA